MKTRYSNDPSIYIDRSRKARSTMTSAQRDAVRTARQLRRDLGGREESTKAADQRRRATKLGVTVNKFKPLDVYERDGWRCGICTKKVRKDLAYPDPMSPSLDHVVPLSLGGEHSTANTRLAHLSCNVRRGNRIGAEQLALIG